jgi:hypothetical protein
MNCRFYDEHAHNHCTEPQAEYVSDTHGRNTCEYFEFKRASSKLIDDPDDPETMRKRRRPDWRNLNKGDDNSGRRNGRRDPFGGNGRSRSRARNPFGDDDSGPSRARNPFGDGPDRQDRAQKARDALDKLFKKDGDK